MKKEIQLQNQVMEELAWDPAINAELICVTADTGHVVLSGHVNSYREKIMAEKAAARVAGVKEISSSLTVVLPTTHRKDDKAIENAVKEMLKWHSAVEHDTIKVKVRHGVVTLTGQVEWSYQCDSIAKVTSNLTGVTSVINRIKIQQKKNYVDLERRIGQAMGRKAGLDTSRIQIMASGNKVTLLGKVNSSIQSKDAADVVWAIPGVVKVDNQLEVEGLINYLT